MSQALIQRLLPIPRLGIRTDVQVLLGVALLAALSQFRIEIGPVPITGQTFGVLLLAAAYGLRLGTLTMISYLILGGALGSFGIGIFAGGTGGWSVLSGATAGYLAGFVVAAALVGFLAQRGWDKSFALTALAMFLGSIVIYALGLPWLQYVTKMPWSQTIAVGLTPFIIGDSIKVLLAATILPLCWTLLGDKKQ